MFERFLQVHPLTGGVSLALEGSLTPELLRRVAGGQSFGGGLYRVHTPASADLMQQHLREVFPDAASHTKPYGYDWLGRQFCATSDHVSATTLMFEPGTGQTLEIPVPFSDIHDLEFVDYADAALAADFFAAYRAVGAPPNVTECIGYVRPLFLGGADDVANLELIDMDVYWHVMGQLIRKVSGLAVGTRIDRAEIG